VCPDGIKSLLKQHLNKGKTMKTNLNESTKAGFEALKEAYAKTGCLVRAKNAAQLTVDQFKELQYAGLVTGKACFDIGIRQPRWFYKLTGIAA
jgi:hypothetical protein